MPLESMWLALAYADDDGNRNGDGNGNWDAIWDTNSHAKCHCHIDAVRRKMYSDAAASPDTSLVHSGRSRFAVRSETLRRL